MAEERNKANQENKKAFYIKSEPRKIKDRIIRYIWKLFETKEKEKKIRT